MAAYAALVSLMNTMNNIQISPQVSTFLDKKQTESLCEKLDFLLDFVESCNVGKAEDLESQITFAAHAAEDVIESHIVDHILVGSKGMNGWFLDLQNVIQDMDSIEKKVINVRKEKGFKDEQPNYSRSAALSRSLTGGKTSMVGFEGYLNQLLDWLTGLQSDRQIIPIVGMAGIGKTTLARNVYENLLIVQHFDVRAWVTVSQEYNVKEILLETLSCVGGFVGKRDERSEEELGEKLYKILSGRRYFIVLDDIWSVEAWDKIKFFFPDNHNRSRIVITTRQSDMASDFGSLGISLKFLDDDKSWELLCEKAFGQEGCPTELEEIGKKIVVKCKGLPLSIVVIGGLLGKSSRKQEYWENVEKDLSSTLNSAEDNQCLNILSLSYVHLPARLKPCFLYLGIFLEDHKFHVSRLIKFWVAEGFLKPNKDKILEEVAEGYIRDLVDRNLVLVDRLGSNGKFKTCYIHDLVRDLCLKVADKEKFLFVTRVPDKVQDIYKQRRIVIHETISKEYYSCDQVFDILNLTSFPRSIIHRSPCQLLLKSRLLRVLSNVYGDTLDTTFEHVNLRLLESYRTSQNGWLDTYKLPSSISLLWNLQTLIITESVMKVVAPTEIWEMPQLRHVCSQSLVLPDPVPSGERDYFVLQNLQTLRTVLNFRCSEEVYKRIPNIKKLYVLFEDNLEEAHNMSYYCLYNVGSLNKLESLHYNFDNGPSRDDLLENLNFPSSLKKLSLENCKLYWDDLTIIGSLPHLEVLKLDSSVIGSEWNPIEGEFLHLKFLSIYSCDLAYWNADSSHFPVLEKLVLLFLYELEEIPLDLGEISTLGELIVSGCSVNASVSAIKILEEQESLGNQSLQVRVEFGDETKLEEFKERLDVEGFTTNNFQLIGG